MSALKPVRARELPLEEFLVPMQLSKFRLAKEIGVPAQRIGQIIAGRRTITADTDLRRCRFFGLSNGCGLRAQAAHDTEVAAKALAPVLRRMSPRAGSAAKLRTDHGWRRALVLVAAVLTLTACDDPKESGSVIPKTLGGPSPALVEPSNQPTQIIVDRLDMQRAVRVVSVTATADGRGVEFVLEAEIPVVGGTLEVTGNPLVASRSARVPAMSVREQARIVVPLPSPADGNYPQGYRVAIDAPFPEEVNGLRVVSTMLGTVALIYRDGMLVSVRRDLPVVRPDGTLDTMWLPGPLQRERRGG